MKATAHENEFIWYSPTKNKIFTTFMGFYDYKKGVNYYANWYGYGDCLYLGIV